MKNILKSIAYRMPFLVQQDLKRYYFRRQIKQLKFISNEPEFKILDDLLREGDWALDIGANVGHYTLRMSEIVGRKGRIFAFEPIPQTFALLSSNTLMSDDNNITLFNLAVSNKFTVLQFEIPKDNFGFCNLYESFVSGKNEGISVVSIDIDNLKFTNQIKLAKIDVEGHELYVLEGMKKLLIKDKPTLIIENSSNSIVSYLAEYGYMSFAYDGSPNTLFK